MKTLGKSTSTVRGPQFSGHLWPSRASFGRLEAALTADRLKARGRSGGCAVPECACASRPRYGDGKAGRPNTGATLAFQIRTGRPLDCCFSAACGEAHLQRFLCIPRDRRCHGLFIPFAVLSYLI